MVSAETDRRVVNSITNENKEDQRAINIFFKEIM